MKESKETSKTRDTEDHKKLEKMPLKTDADKKETGLDAFENEQPKNFTKEAVMKNFDEEKAIREQQNASNLFNELTGEETLHVPGYDLDEESEMISSEEPDLYQMRLERESDVEDQQFLTEDQEFKKNQPNFKINNENYTPKAWEEREHFAGLNEVSKENTYDDIFQSTSEGIEKNRKSSTIDHVYSEFQEYPRKRKHKVRSLFIKLSAALSLLVLTSLIAFLIWPSEPEYKDTPIVKSTASVAALPGQKKKNKTIKKDKVDSNVEKRKDTSSPTQPTASVAALPGQKKKDQNVKKNKVDPNVEKQRDTSSSLFTFESVKMNAKMKAEILLEEPDVIAVFYPKNFNEEQLKQNMKKIEKNFSKKDEYLSFWEKEEMAFKEVIQPVKANDFENIMRDADDLWISIGEEHLNENDFKKSLAKKVLDTSILQHQALEQYASVNFEKETNKRFKQLFQRVNNKNGFNKWIAARYGSEKAFKNLLRKKIIEEKYLNVQKINRDEVIKELRSNLEILERK